MYLVRLFASFDGRIGRGPFLLWMLVIAIVGYAAEAASLAPLVATVPSASGAPDMQAILNALMPKPRDLVISTALAAAAFMVSLKRAHDLEKSGWWLAGWSLAGFVATILGTIGGGLLLASAAAGGVAMAIAAVLGVGALFQLAIRLPFFAGSDGDNHFGPPGLLDAFEAKDASRSNRLAANADELIAKARLASAASAGGQAPAWTAGRAAPAAPQQPRFGKRTSNPA